MYGHQPHTAKLKGESSFDTEPNPSSVPLSSPPNPQRYRCQPPPTRHWYRCQGPPNRQRYRCQPSENPERYRSVQTPFTTNPVPPIISPPRGCSSMVERQLPKLHTRVRFPSPAPSIFKQLCRSSASVARPCNRRATRCCLDRLVVWCGLGKFDRCLSACPSRRRKPWHRRRGTGCPCLSLSRMADDGGRRSPLPFVRRIGLTGRW